MFTMLFIIDPLSAQHVYFRPFDIIKYIRGSFLLPWTTFYLPKSTIEQVSVYFKGNSLPFRGQCGSVALDFTVSEVL